MAKCYPANLILEGQDCLVVGGGRTAVRKVAALLEADAAVRVVARVASGGLVKLAEEGRITLAVRDAGEADLGEALVVILATDDEALNRRLARAAKARRQLVNVVDVPELCTFYVPASVRRGPILLTVGSDGAAPALTKHLRERIEEQFGEEWGELAEIMSELRDSVKARFATQAERAAAWERVLASGALELLREGKREEARRVVEGEVREASPPCPPLPRRTPATCGRAECAPERGGNGTSPPGPLSTRGEGGDDERSTAGGIACSQR